MIAIRYPKAMNAPGAKTNINIPYSSEKMVRSKIFPVPRSSRTEPKIVKANVKPKPMPKPSKKEEIGLFLLAKASARPRIKQFTTISGMKSPNEAYNSGL